MPTTVFLTHTYEEFAYEVIPCVEVVFKSSDGKSSTINIPRDE